MDTHGSRLFGRRFACCCCTFYGINISIYTWDVDLDVRSKYQLVIMVHFYWFCKQMLDREVSSLMNQLESANESGQEVMSHLQDTSQDSKPVVEKVDGVNSQWEQLQVKLQELRSHVKPLVSFSKLCCCLLPNTFEENGSFGY